MGLRPQTPDKDAFCVRRASLASAETARGRAKRAFAGLRYSIITITQGGPLRGAVRGPGGSSCGARALAFGGDGRARRALLARSG